MKIRGQIDYELSVDDKGEWSITYEGNVDNDIAAVAITQSVLEAVCSGISAQSKDTQDTRTKKHLKAILEKGMAAHFGGNLILEYMQSIYLDFKAHQEKSNASIEKEDGSPLEPLKIVPSDDLSLLKEPEVADEAKLTIDGKDYIVGVDKF